MDFHQDRSGSVFPLVAVSDGTFSPSTVCNDQLYNYTYTYKTTQYTYRDTCRWASHVARAPACRGCTRSCRGSTPRPRGTCQGCTATGPRRSSARPADTCHESRGQCHVSRDTCTVHLLGEAAGPGPGAAHAGPLPPLPWRRPRVWEQNCKI